MSWWRCGRLRRAGPDQADPAGHDEGPQRLGGAGRRIPRDLETIVHKAIEGADPATRPAGELAADLQRFLDDQPIRPAGVDGRAGGGWSRRHKAWAAVLVGAAVSVRGRDGAAAMVAASYFRHRPM